MNTNHLFYPLRLLSLLSLALLLPALAACNLFGDDEDELISDRNPEAICGTWQCVGMDEGEGITPLSGTSLTLNISTTAIEWHFSPSIPYYTRDILNPPTPLSDFTMPYTIIPSGDTGDEASIWTLHVTNLSDFGPFGINIPIAFVNKLQSQPDGTSAIRPFDIIADVYARTLYLQSSGPLGGRYVFERTE